MSQCFLTQKPPSKYLVMSMASISIFSVCLILQDIQKAIKNFYSLEITLIEENKVLKPLRFCWLTKSNFLSNFIYCAVIMNVKVLIGCMDFTMNAREDIILEYGKISVSVLITCLLVRLLMIGFYACMVDLVLTYMIQKLLMDFKDPRMYQIKDYCAICYGQIQKLIYKDGQKMIEEFHLYLAKMSSKSLLKSIG